MVLGSIGQKKTLNEFVFSKKKHPSCSIATCTFRQAKVQTPTLRILLEHITGQLCVEEPLLDFKDGNDTRLIVLTLVIQRCMIAASVLKQVIRIASRWKTRRLHHHQFRGSTMVRARIIEELQEIPNCSLP